MSLCFTGRTLQKYFCKKSFPLLCILPRIPIPLHLYHFQSSSSPYCRNCPLDKLDNPFLLQEHNEVEQFLLQAHRMTFRISERAGSSSVGIGTNWDFSSFHPHSVGKGSSSLIPFHRNTCKWTLSEWKWAALAVMNEWMNALFTTTTYFNKHKYGVNSERTIFQDDYAWRYGL